MFVHQADRPQYIRLVGFHNVSIHHHLLENEMRSLQVEHNIQLTLFFASISPESEANLQQPVITYHVLKVLIQRLYQCVNKLQDSQLILLHYRSASVLIQHPHNSASLT